MNKSTLWAKNILIWLWKPRLLLFFAVCFVALFFSFVCFRTEIGFRYSGLMLQIMGIITVILGMKNTRTQFVQQPIHTIIMEWLKQSPKYNNVINALTATMGVSGAALTGHLTTCTDVSKDVTLQERVDAVEKNILHLREELNGLYTEFELETQKLTKKISKEKVLIVQEIYRVKEDLLHFAIDGLKLAAVGTGWLFLGVILSTASPEIVKLLN